ncbi:uncharacterized protein LOC135936408 [Cloeon dipterum]|uniref:uncharacterized protein LOC135936408 n=1 Tax=Cloeon dipterum TaxID=197152 RepID=UPI0032203221
MREILLLLVCLASLGPLTSHPTNFPSRNGGEVGRSRPRRQLSEIVRLYNEMNEENQKERAEALDKIRAILSRTFLSPNDTTTTLVPPNNSTSSEDGETTTTQKPKIDRQMLLANLRRNLRGIGRLFMRELRTALATSRDNFYIFGGQVRDSIRSLFSRASISVQNTNSNSAD